MYKIGQLPLRTFALAVICLLSFDAHLAKGQETQPVRQENYRIKPSDVSVPDGTPLGQYKRSIRPFENWTLICDENLKTKQMICNVTQTIVNSRDELSFSWSLAATKSGQPFFLLRVMPQADPEAGISLTFTGRKQPVMIALEGCNDAVCVGKTPVGPILREQIQKEAEPVISYATKSGQTILIKAPLKGLAEALSAIE